ncbi:MAG TPA: hypothetical protein VKL40_03975 [Candidatus Angelobacter sp.]|nr:hypothetical protein [Candidatus Angelobacter sp.]
MEPVTTITTAWTLAKTAGEIGKKLFDFSKELKDHNEKQRVDEILDQLRELKQSATELEDENRELREKLRFKSDAYEFHNPFWYEKGKHEQPFCAKCFAKPLAAPMSEVRRDGDYPYRRCLVCSNVEVLQHQHQASGFSGSGPQGWMAR